MTRIDGFSRIGGAALAALVLMGGLMGGAGTALAQDQKERVNVYQYAVDHPQADAQMKSAPSLGASVPQAVELARVEGEQDYGYFYFDGRPVLVDMRTRSVVRVDQ
ncbi:DUF1236 domain-containing protein [Aureimonas sp. Leaf324]|jgi:hypothetical protein|uniref:DUF1236 domain-containing protein n=1 Tax=Aureimonas sp. Leaf324 TaxID=1736336 RepID=UPI0006FC25E4|nr:DUF1236 domain-containing protein [Aureimonas sp. Leaf324]KQQ78894.1 hypothetical protein ASF65_15065 [Aureimonas sp. Leaf324]